MALAFTYLGLASLFAAAAQSLMCTHTHPKLPEYYGSIHTFKMQRALTIFGFCFGAVLSFLFSRSRTSITVTSLPGVNMPKSQKARYTAKRWDDDKT